MNILEHYIKEIHSIKPCTEEWITEFPYRELLEIELTSDCYGRIERETYIWSSNQWEQIKEQGYFMG